MKIQDRASQWHLDFLKTKESFRSKIRMTNASLI
jgi:hypothetical protein